MGGGPFHPMRLGFALVEPPDRDQAGVDFISGGTIRVGTIRVGTVQPGTPCLKPIDQTLGGVSVTTAAFPVNQAACRAIVSLPDPELVGLFFK